jgi:hypothetical protein
MKEQFTNISALYPYYIRIFVLKVIISLDISASLKSAIHPTDKLQQS